MISTLKGKKDRMRMNKKKTKIMCNGAAKRQQKRGISVDREQLEEVDEYKYLGRLLTPENGFGRKWKTVWAVQHLPERPKDKIRNGVIRSKKKVKDVTEKV